MALDPEAALAAIRARTKAVPAVAIVLGSGLGRLADDVTAATRIPYADIPGWERSTAPGHSGELVVGTLGGKPVAVMRGRLHYYEGYDMAAIAFPVRVFKAWGIDTIILTNACGGLNPKLKAGDLMLSAPGWAVHNHASYDEYVYELTVQDQPLNIAMESLLWQENLKTPMAVLGQQEGFSTNRDGTRKKAG